MDKNTKNIQIIPFLISITLIIILIALTGTRNILEIIYISIGAFLGTFLLDLDYILYAYWMEPKKEFSRNLTAYIKHRDFKNALIYIKTHKNDIPDKTLNSALFQIVFVLFAVFIINSPNNTLIKVLTLSTIANSLYRMAEYYFENRINYWFWSFKNKPSKKGFIFYTIGVLLVLTYCIASF